MLHRTLILGAMMFWVASCGSRQSGPKPIEKVVYLATPIQPCLKNPPPNRPVLSCDQAIPNCPERDTDLAALLDYLTALDRWVRVYAWPVCRVVK